VDHIIASSQCMLAIDRMSIGGLANRLYVISYDSPWTRMLVHEFKNSGELLTLAKPKR